MKNLLFPAVLLFVLANPALAQTMSHENMEKGMMKHDTGKLGTVGTMTEGEVKAVDKAKGTITLNHGEIRTAKMPAMTMAYKAKDPALLSKVAPGDKVAFALEPAGNAYVVSAIERK